MSVGPVTIINLITKVIRMRFFLFYRVYITIEESVVISESEKHKPTMRMRVRIVRT